MESILILSNSSLWKKSRRKDITVTVRQLEGDIFMLKKEKQILNLATFNRDELASHGSGMERYFSSDELHYQLHNLKQHAFENSIALE